MQPQVPADSGIANTQEGMSVPVANESPSLPETQAEREDQYWRAQLTRQRAQLRSDQSRLEEVGERFRALGSQLDAKEAEIRHLKILLSIRNESSDEDILIGLDHINNLIEDFARRNCQRWLGSSSEGILWNSADPMPLLLAESLGKDFLHLLRDTPENGEYAPLVLQFTWQAVLGRAVCWVLETMQPASRNPLPPRHHLMNKLASSIQMTESQLAYGHWRAITYRAMRNDVSAEEASGSLESRVERAILSCRHGLGLLLKQKTVPKLETELDAPVREVLEASIKLARVIHEEAMGKNYVAVAVNSGTRFDAQEMVLEAEEDSATSDDRVACSTRIGLYYTRKQERRGEESTQRVILRKAQVVTMSVLDEIGLS